MSETETQEDLKALEKEFYMLSQRLAKARKAYAPEPVEDHAFDTPQGTVHLSELFGDRDDLLVVHNMGKGCAYCTLWADGFVGLHPHILDRTAFAISSPDSPEVQGEFADSRGWPFRMVSTQNSDFTKAMGYEMAAGYMPGVSAFRRQADGSIVRTGHTPFGPGDQFCGVWPMFDLLSPDGGEWKPRFAYGEAADSPQS